MIFRQKFVWSADESKLMYFIISIFDLISFLVMILIFDVNIYRLHTVHNFTYLVDEVLFLVALWADGHLNGRSGEGHRVCAV